MRLDESIPGGVHDYCAPELTAAPTRLPRVLHELLEYNPDVLCLQARSRRDLGEISAGEILKYNPDVLCLQARSRRDLARDLPATPRRHLDGISARSRRDLGTQEVDISWYEKYWQPALAASGYVSLMAPKRGVSSAEGVAIAARSGRDYSPRLFAEMRSRDCSAVTSRLPARAHALAPSHPSQHA